MIRLLVLLILAATASPAFATDIEPDSHGISLAPIHGEDVRFKVIWKKSLPPDRQAADVVGKTLHIDWNGSLKTPKGHSFPALYVRVELQVPSGAGLVARTDRPMKAIHIPVTDRDQYSFDLPIRQLKGNTTEFFLKLEDGLVGEFYLEYEIKLDDTVFGLHRNCEREGVRMTEKSNGNVPTFLFMNCVREDRVLYLNILKPLDMNILSESPTSTLLSASGPPVLRVQMMNERRPKKAVIGELVLVDPNDKRRKSDRWEITYTSKGPTGWHLAFGLGLGVSVHTDGTPVNVRVKQIPLTGLYQVGYIFLPGYSEAALDVKGTFVSKMITDTPLSTARWFNIGYRLGFLFPLGEREHVFGAYLGWYHYIMAQSTSEYGIVRQGVSNLGGPQLTVNMRFRPVGRLGWSAYAKYAPLAESIGALELGKLQRGEANLGATVDLPFSTLERRPALFLDASWLNVLVQNVEISETSGTLGLIIPIL